MLLYSPTIDVREEPTMTTNNHLTHLQQEIERLRTKMVDIATSFGYTSEQSIKVSQELDALLNEYQLVVKDKTRMSSDNFY